MRIWMLGLAPLAWAFAGCTEAPALVPVAPPGLEYQRNIPIPEDATPQALGETPRKPAGEGEAVVAGESTSAEVQEGLPATEPGEARTTKTGLKYETLKKGTGAEVKTGQRAVVHYTGTFPDGAKFDSSVGGDPLTFQIGTPGIIKGWNEGVNGMKVGEKRKLTVPPELAYGKAGRGKIPPDATLLFDIELIDVK